ncbi:hypothetical protein ACOSQ2_001911 [Xanthoceras sorbifolium]
MCPTKHSNGRHYMPPPPYMILPPCPPTLDILRPPYTAPLSPPLSRSRPSPLPQISPHIRDSGLFSGNNNSMDSNNNTRHHQPAEERTVNVAMFEQLQQSVSFLEEMVATLMMSRQDSIRHSMELNVPSFDGLLGIEEFLDWLNEVEALFDYMEIAEDKKVKLIACKLKGGASAWWRQVRSWRVRQNKSKIQSWDLMKQLMITRFLPIDYKDILFLQYLNCYQGGRSVQEYVDEFYRLSARNDLQESEDLIEKFVGGLRAEIREKVALRFDHTLSDAIRLATVLEQQMHESESEATTCDSSLGDDEDESCNGCGQTSDKTSSIEEDAASSTVSSTLAREGLCLLASRLSDNRGGGDQRHNTFQTRCAINEVDCDLIIHHSCTTNIVSKSIVDELHLKTHKHPSPYRLNWIIKSEKIKVTKQCRVSFSVGELYRDEVLCDVIDMDACDFLLGRPWAVDLNATFNGRNNTYTFYKDNRKVVLAPMKFEDDPPSSKPQEDDRNVAPRIHYCLV